MSQTTSDTWFIIVNPAAGNGTSAKIWPRIQTQLRRQNLAFRAVFSERKGHATQLAAQAVRDGFRKLMAVGGPSRVQPVPPGRPPVASPP